MSVEASVRNLQIITALDSLSYGLIYGFISTYILILGGSHISVAILAIANLIAELLSVEVIKVFTHLHGKRYALFFILNTAVVTHLMLVLTDSYWFTILIRILFSLTNQSQNLCLELLLNKAQNDEDKEKLQQNYSILSGSGYIIGPIVTGYIFDYGFGYVGILAALISLLNVNLLMNVTRDSRDVNPEHTEIPVLEKAINKVTENVQDFKNCNAKKHWDLLLLKYLFAGGIIIFFSKFTQIINYNYDASNVVMGYTGSYINILVFAATYYVAVVEMSIQKYHLIFITQIAFILIAFLMLIACYAPYYELYMFLLIPITFLRSLIITVWKDLYFERRNESLNKLNNSISVLAGVTIPLFFGATCNHIAHNAVILFSFVPMILCFIVLRLYSRFIKIESEETDNKKDS